MYRNFFELQHEPTEKPAPWRRTPKQRKHINQRLKQPPFQQSENLNPSTATSLSGFFGANAWNTLKGTGGTAGIAVGTVEVAPNVTGTADAVGRRTHDTNSVIDYATGKSEHPYTEYPPDAPADSQNKFYEDLSWREWFRCNYLWWGPPCPPSKKDPVVCNTQC